MRLVELCCLVRCLRWSWQNTESALLEISAYHLARTLLLGGTTANDVYLSFYQSIYLSVYLYLPSIYLPIYLSFKLYIYPPIYLSIFHLSIYLSIVDYASPMDHLYGRLTGLNGLALVGLARDRLGQVIKKLMMVFVLTATSMEKRVSR